MNIYKLNNKDLHKKTIEFNQTSFGKRVRYITLLPIIVTLIWLEILLVFTVINCYCCSCYFIDFTIINKFAITGVILVIANLLAQNNYNRELRKYITLEK